MVYGLCVGGWLGMKGCHSACCCCCCCCTTGFAVRPSAAVPVPYTSPSRTGFEGAAPAAVPPELVMRFAMHTRLSGGAASPVTAVAVCPDMTMLACGTDAGSISTWSLASGMLLTTLGARLPDDDDPPQHGSQHSHGARLLHPVGVIRSLRSSSSRWGQHHSSSVTALLFSASGRHLVSGDADGALMVWDMGTAQAVRCVRAFTQGVVALADPTARSPQRTATDSANTCQHRRVPAHGQSGVAGSGGDGGGGGGSGRSGSGRSGNEPLPRVLALGIISRGAGCLALWDMEAGHSLATYLGGDALDTQTPGRAPMIEDIGWQVGVGLVLLRPCSFMLLLLMHAAHRMHRAAHFKCAL